MVVMEDVTEDSWEEDGKEEVLDEVVMKDIKFFFHIYSLVSFGRILQAYQVECA